MIYERTELPGPLLELQTISTVVRDWTAGANAGKFWAIGIPKSASSVGV